MNSKHMMTMACAVALCGSVLADTNETVNAEAAAGWNWAMGEGVAFEETPIVSAEVSLAFDSSLRHRARDYEATGHWTDSWNFTAGVSLSASF